MSKYSSFVQGNLWKVSGDVASAVCVQRDRYINIVLHTAETSSPEPCSTLCIYNYEDYKNGKSTTVHEK